MTGGTLLAERYRPTSQKGLFHKDVIPRIRKWTSSLDTCDDHKCVLYIHGPVGCGKTTMINVLFKQYNMQHIDADAIRSADNYASIVQTLTAFEASTLEHVFGGSKNGSVKRNIVVIDTVELCERNVRGFIDAVHKKSRLDVPVVVLGTNPSLEDALGEGYGERFTAVGLQRPSPLELSNLVYDINKAEGWGLTQSHIKDIVRKSAGDARQILFVLGHLSLRREGALANFSDFLDSLQTIETDIDLQQRLLHVFDRSVPYQFNEILMMCAPDSTAVGYGVFQNYPELCDDCETATSIAEWASVGNVFSSKVFNEQVWELADYIPVCSSVAPSYSIKSASQLFEGRPTGHELMHSLRSYKDMSYNYINSLEELKRLVRSHIEASRTSLLTPPADLFALNNHDLVLVVSPLKTQVAILNQYFEARKRGKNVSKQEKMQLCQSIPGSDTRVQSALEWIVNVVFSYRLFEIQYGDVTLLKEKFDPADVDLRIVKRLINVFSLEDTSKLFKPATDLCVKYHVLQRVLQALKPQPKSTVEQRIVDLAEIWNLGV